MIIASELFKKFGDLIAIKNVSLKVNKGDFIGVIGESGSGKSTLLYMLGGLLKPTSGSVLINDQDITKMNDKELSAFRTCNIGFVFQFSNLIKGLTVIENMEIPLVLAHQNLAKNAEQIRYLLECVGLQGYEKHKAEELSGGQQQRVAIARALINNPSVIFADEPTGSLDSENTENIVQLLAKLNKEQNVTIIMVTHSQKTLTPCNKVIEINDGRMQKHAVSELQKS